MIKIVFENNNNIKQMPKECIRGATLLTDYQVENILEPRLKILSCCLWWLKSPSLDNQVCYVDSHGEIDYAETYISLQVRPVLIIDTESLDVSIGDRFLFGKSFGRPAVFEIISESLALCLDGIGECCFSSATDKSSRTNIYAKSEVKKYVDDWFNKSYSKYKNPVQSNSRQKIGLIMNIFGSDRVKLSNKKADVHDKNLVLNYIKKKFSNKINNNVSGNRNWMLPDGSSLTVDNLHADTLRDIITGLSQDVSYQFYEEYLKQINDLYDPYSSEGWNYYDFPEHSCGYAGEYDIWRFARDNQMLRIFSEDKKTPTGRTYKQTGVGVLSGVRPTTSQIYAVGDWLIELVDTGGAEFFIADAPSGSNCFQIELHDDEDVKRAIGELRRMRMR